VTTNLHYFQATGQSQVMCDNVLRANNDVFVIDAGALRAVVAGTLGCDEAWGMGGNIEGFCFLDHLPWV